MSIVHERNRANAYSWQYCKGLGKIPKTKGQAEKVELSSLVTGSELNKGASFKNQTTNKKHLDTSKKTMRGEELSRLKEDILDFSWYLEPIWAHVKFMAGSGEHSWPSERHDQ